MAPAAVCIPKVVLWTQLGDVVQPATKPGSDAFLFMQHDSF